MQKKRLTHDFSAFCKAWFVLNALSTYISAIVFTVSLGGGRPVEPVRFKFVSIKLTYAYGEPHARRVEPKP